MLFFDVTKHPILGIDNSMDTGLRMARFVSVVVPVYNSALILPDLIKRLAPEPAFLSNKKGCNSKPLLGFLVGSNREFNG